MLYLPMLAHGGGLIPLMFGGSLAAAMFIGGLILATAGKNQSRALVGMGLIGASFLVALTSWWLARRMM